MNMFGAEPGAGFSPPTRAEQPGGELRLTLDGSEYLIRAGQTARIGRAPDNDLVTEAPTVSRHHGVLRWGATGWEFENAGSAPTFVGGQQVTRVLVDRPLSLTLGSPDGPVLQFPAAGWTAFILGWIISTRASTGSPPGQLARAICSGRC